MATAPSRTSSTTEQKNGSASLAIGDLNGDGSVDLAIAKRDHATVSTFTNAGDASAWSKRDYQAPAAAVAIGDVNGDGRLDVATANFGSNTVSVFANRTGDHVRICMVPNLKDRGSQRRSGRSNARVVERAGSAASLTAGRKES
jgi:FG-GAP-like repeat